MDDLISRKAAIDAVRRLSLGETDALRLALRIDDYLERLPSAQSEPCENDPRADVYYLAEKIGIHQLYALVVALRGEPEPCEDTISRQDAIRVASGFCHPANIAKELAKLPSAQPDMSEYSDKLWKAAYERGKAEAQAEIIRCKDCKYWREGTVYLYCDKLFGMGVLDVYDYMTDEDDYCSMAERKTDEKENI